MSMNLPTSQPPGKVIRPNAKCIVAQREIARARRNVFSMTGVYFYICIVFLLGDFSTPVIVPALGGRRHASQLVLRLCDYRR